jgi:hypothetical protein
LDLSDALTYSNQFLAFGDIGSLNTGTNQPDQHGKRWNRLHPTWGRWRYYTNTINQQHDVQFPDNSVIQSGGLSGDLTGPKLSVGGTYTLTRGSYDISPNFWDQTVGFRLDTSIANVRRFSLNLTTTIQTAIAVEYFGGNAGVGGSWRYSRQEASTWLQVLVFLAAGGASARGLYHQGSSKRNLRMVTGIPLLRFRPILAAIHRISVRQFFN